MSNMVNNEVTAKQAIVAPKDSTSSEPSNHTPWSSWELSIEGTFYYRGRKGVNDEWEYEYGYPSSQSYDTPTKETTETSSKYIYPPPITYPKDDLKVIYAERLKPTYIPTVVGLLAPETPVTRTDLSDSTTKNSKPPGTECEKTSPRHNENGSTGVKPGGEPGAGGEKSAYSVQNVQESEKTTNVIPKVENVETMARKQKSENPGKKVRKDQKDRKSKKEKSTTFEKKDKNDKTKKTSKDKKTKNRNPVSQIDLVARWRDNVNNMMEGAQIGMSDRGEGPIEIGDKPAQDNSKE